MVYKKLVPQGLKKIPQFKSIQGWILLTYENCIPICLWVTQKDTKKLKICLDERLFSDTILKVEKVSYNKYVISDIFMYSSTNIFILTNYEERYKWLTRLINTFYKHIETFDELYLKSDLECNEFPIKGYEYYDSKKGSYGYYSDKKEIVIKSNIPDVYYVKDKEGFLLVPDLKTSEYLRSLFIDSNEIDLDIEEKDGRWFLKSFE